MENITFFREWLPLQKSEFRILAMLADRGEFKGNLSELCDYFSLTRQTRNRDQLKSSIQKLQEQGLIECEISGRTYTLRAVPKAEKLEIPRAWMERITAHNYTSESVAWEQVLKVYLWIAGNTEPVVTNQMIAADLDTSISTIGYAKNVLQREYEAITRKKVSDKLGDGSFRTIGQELAAVAWWSAE